MAKKNNNTMLILAAAAVGVYLFMKNSATAAAVAPGPGILLPGASGGGVLAPVVNMPAAGVNSFGLPASLSTSAAVVNPGVDPSQLNVVAQWAASSGNAGAMNLVRAAVPSEISGMYDIITNDWAKTGIATDAQTSLWNNLVSKYGL
jgi:hypothetical protein